MATIPSIALIPSGVKAGKLYSVLPTNGDGDFTTTRNTVATRVNENGLIEEVASNVPRLDYSDGGCPSLLLENSSTNLITYSEDFSNAYWSTARIETPYIADTISPDGTLNAYTLEISSGETGGGGVYKSLSVVGDNSISVFAKKSTVDYLVLADTGLDSSRNAVYFNLENGTVATEYNAVGKMQDFGNGWYRCTMKYTLTSFGNKFIYMTNIDGSTSNAVQGGDSIYIYGAQVEQNSYATSYIKTVGTTQSRSADTANGAGNASTFNDSSGVLMAEISALANDGTNKTIGILGDSNNLIELAYRNTSNQVRFLIKSSGVVEVNIQHTLSDIMLNNKLAIKYKSNNASLYVNGFEVDTDLSANMPNGLNELNFNRFDGAEDFYGSTKQIQYFDSALNDSELEKLTSWTSFTAMANAQSYTII